MIHDIDRSMKLPRHAPGTCLGLNEGTVTRNLSCANADAKVADSDNEGQMKAKSSGERRTGRVS